VVVLGADEREVKLLDFFGGLKKCGLILILGCCKSVEAELDQED